MIPEERSLARQLAAEVGEALAAEQQQREDAGRARLDELGREALAEQLVRAKLSRIASDRLARREAMLDPDGEDRVAEAVLDRVCGARGFARYLARDDVEEVVFNSHDNVWVYLSDGARLRGDPVADTPGELVEDTRLLASTAGRTERRFDAGSPRLNLRLPDGSRLYAVMDVTGDSPAGAVRRSRYPRMDLDQLVELGTIDKALHSLLQAMIRSGMRVILSGETGSGKTATLRALISLLDRADRVIAIEDTAELDLARLRGPDANTLELEARQANVEGAGEVTQRDLVRDALRLRPDWLVMAEVRGGEALDMLTAMSHGRRSLSTIHAARVADVPEKLALYCLLAPERVPIEATHYLVHMSVDFIVHMQEFPGERRAVAEVAEVAQFDEKMGKVQLNRVFSPGPDGRAVPGSPSAAGGGHITTDRLDKLVAAGFDDTLLANPPRLVVAMTGVALGILGGGAGLGMLIVIGALRGDLRSTGGPRWRERLATVERAQLRMLLAAGLAVGVLAVSGWPALAVVAAGVGWVGPGLLGASRRRQAAMARTEAVAAWAEMLRDTLAAGGLREAILASRRVAPAPIAAEVATLAERSEYSPLGVALRQFAGAVDDPVADHVVAALVVAAERQASGLRDMLGRVAASAREQAGMRMRIEAGRARTYAQARFVVGFTPLFAVAVGLLSPGYFTPFGTFAGQLVLAAVGAAFIASLWSLQRLAAPAATARLLGDAPAGASGSGSLAPVPAVGPAR